MNDFGTGQNPDIWQSIGGFLQNVGQSYLQYVEDQETRKAQLQLLQAQTELEKAKAARAQAEKGVDISKYLPWIAIAIAAFFVLKKK